MYKRSQRCSSFRSFHISCLHNSDFRIQNSFLSIINCILAERFFFRQNNLNGLKNSIIVVGSGEWQTRLKRLDVSNAAHKGYKLKRK